MKTKELHLSDVEWKPFLIAGKKGIFNIKATKSGINKNKLNIEKGSTPYITRTEINNGINLFVTENQNKKYIMDTSNSITIGLDTQSVFYQEHDFFTGQNIQVLKCDRLNKKNALFIIPLLKIQMKKFNWGGNGATLGRLNRTQIMLPVDKKGNPNWQFMEDYIKQEQKKTSDKVLTYYENKLNKIKSKLAEYEFSPDDDVERKTFKIKNIFNLHVKSAGGLNRLTQIENGMPYIGATNRNNGVMTFVDQTGKDKLINKGNAIVFIRNGEGSVGYSIYKKENFIATQDVIMGYNTELNEFNGLYITTMSDTVRGKYNFGYKRNKHRLENEKIILPQTKNGKPDYNYMEWYVLTEQKRQIDMIIKYLKEKY